MTMISVNEFKNGLTIQYNNDLWRIVEFQHVKPGKGSAFVRSKLKSLRTGAVQEYTFRSTAKVETADIQTKSMQYLYNDGSSYVFMDTSTYDQLAIPKSDKAALLQAIQAFQAELAAAPSASEAGKPATTVETPVATETPVEKEAAASEGSKPATTETETEPASAAVTEASTPDAPSPQN